MIGLRTTAALALLIGLAACAPAAVTVPTLTPSAATPAATPSLAATVTEAASPAALPTDVPATEPAGPPEAGLPPAQATVVGLAADDLAERTGVAADEIELALIAADDLPAGDLGCRGKGTPAGVQAGLVTGWVIRLRAADSEYEYHAHGGQVAYCGAVVSP